jgi:hypothetical protein
LDFKLTCASDSYKFDFSGSSTAATNGSLEGQWSEASRNIGGDISGTVAGERANVLVETSGFSGELTIVTRDRRQTVTMRLRGAGETALVSIQLSRR